MKIKDVYLSFTSCVLFVAALSCSKDDSKPTCDTFSSADSVCFCTKNPDDLNCVSAFSISVYTTEKPALTPHTSNGTIWCKGFAIGRSIFVIDRESSSPHAFWKFNLDANTAWETKANFPGTDYGLTGSANGKGYASSYASNKFWEYDPATNEWTPLADLPFSPGETHWAEYNGKFYVPYNNGVYEFTPSTKEWKKFSDQTSVGFGGLYLVGDNMYWFNINNDYMSRINLATKSFKKIDLPLDFGKSVAFNSPFTIDNKAFVAISSNLWVFDSETETWSVDPDGITSGAAYADDVFLIDGAVYLIDNSVLKVFGGVK